MVTSASVSGPAERTLSKRRDERLRAARRVGRRVRRNQARPSAVASPVTLSASVSDASNSCERSCSVTYRASASSSNPISASPVTLLSMSEISVNFRRSRTEFDHCWRLSRAMRGVATSADAGGDAGIAYGSSPCPPVPPEPDGELPSPNPSRSSDPVPARPIRPTWPDAAPLAPPPVPPDPGCPEELPLPWPLCPDEPPWGIADDSGTSEPAASNPPKRPVTASFARGVLFAR